MSVRKRLFFSERNLLDLRAVANWFWRASQGVRARIVCSCLLGIFEVACSLCFVWSSKMVIDVATGSLDESLWKAGGLTVFFVVLQIAFSGIDMWLNGSMPIDLGNRLRRHLFGHLLNSRWEELEKYHSGDVLNRVSRDIDDVVRLLTGSLPAVLVTLVQFLASFFFLYRLDGSLAWLLIGVVPIFLLVSKLYVRRMREYNIKIRKSDSYIQSIIQESVQQHVVIKTMEQQEYKLNRLDGLQTGLRKQVLGRTRLSLFSRVMMSGGFNGGYLLVFFWGAVRLSRGEISFGTMTAFLQLVGRVQRPAYDLAHFFPSFITAYTAAERLMELEAVSLEEAGEKVVVEGPVGLKFSNVSFSYGSEEKEEVLSGMTAEFPAGSTTAILGETGAGKTTLIRLILALVVPQEGRISLLTQEGEVTVTPGCRANFVYVPQGNTLFSGTIRDNLLLGDPSATDGQMENALRLAAADFVFDLPDGLNTLLSEHGGGVSEGQAQRIAIARALLRKGSILLLDEATSALDQETEKKLVANLRNHCSGKTVIFITHHPELAEMCDRTCRVTHPFR